MEKRWVGPEDENEGKRRPGPEVPGRGTLGRDREMQWRDGETVRERQALRERDTHIGNRETGERQKETCFESWSERQRK